MGLREKLGNWLLGGALEKAELNARLWRADYNEARVAYARSSNDSVKLDFALKQIAALETKGANATVRKMARIAREATK